jgi:hypothetical protein
MAGSQSGQPLRLRAIDAGDLPALSAHLQDAILRVGDMTFVPSRRRFVLMLNRFLWEDLSDGAGPRADPKSPYRRARTAVHFDGVLSVKTQGLNLLDKDAIAALLAVKFDERDDGAGALILLFSGGGAIRLDVECVDAWSTDIGQPWSTPNLPRHDRDADQAPDGKKA